MNNFYFHYLSYADGLSVMVKSLIFEDITRAGLLYNMKDKKQIEDFFRYHGIEAKEATYAAFRLSSGEIKKKAEREYGTFSGIRFVDFSMKDYPERLRHIYNAPFGLYVRGGLPVEEKPCVAVIGARECSEYGAKWTEIYTQELCEQGVQIISGMAKGIDGIAGRCAVKYEGLSFAVLGSGINVCYPESNRDLYNDLCKKGSLISEYPPDTKAEPFRFPYRNRIISGLCDCVFVAEAAIKSGSHITAYFALEQGKDVFALPGPVDSRLSQGTNNLIKNGACPALDVNDILQSLKRFH